MCYLTLLSTHADFEHLLMTKIFIDLVYLSLLKNIRVRRIIIPFVVLLGFPRIINTMEIGLEKIYQI